MASTGAQGTAVAEPAECLGFAFGRFVPALDLKAAGHTHLPSPDQTLRAPDSRDWAARDSNAAGTSLMLFPAWWPVGVQVVLPARSDGDTLRGVAYALVADGRVVNPQAQVLAWAVPCGRPGRSTAPPPVAGGSASRSDSAPTTPPLRTVSPPKIAKPPKKTPKP